MLQKELCFYVSTCDGYNIHNKSKMTHYLTWHEFTSSQHTHQTGIKVTTHPPEKHSGQTSKTESIYGLLISAYIPTKTHDFKGRIDITKIDCCGSS